MGRIHLESVRLIHVSVAYPELVSGGFPSHKFKGLVKVSASNGVIRVDWKKIMAGGRGFPGNQNNPLDTPLRRLSISQQLPCPQPSGLCLESY